MKKRYNAAGVSLIIAIIFVSAFMLIMAGLVEAQLKTITTMRNRDMEGKAKYFAEGAMELAAYYAGISRVGANALSSELTEYSNVLTELASDIGITNCTAATPCAGFEIRGRPNNTQKVKLNDTEYFSVPVRGTGDVAGDCTLPDGDGNSANDGCHWNKLYVGQSVEIPLYYEDESGASVKLDLRGMGDFKLRIRTPCKSGESGPTCNRVVLYPMPGYEDTGEYLNVEKDPVLVQWLISDLDNNQTLVAADRRNRDPVHRMWRPDYNETSIPSLKDNTEISAVKINDAYNDPKPLRDFIVLFKEFIPTRELYGKNINSKAQQKIIDFLPLTTRPILRITLVRQPYRDADENAATDMTPAQLNDSANAVPHLEYQFLTNVVAGSISDSRSYVRAWAQIGDFRREMERYIERPETLGGFAVESF